MNGGETGEEEQGPERARGGNSHTVEMQGIRWWVKYDVYFFLFYLCVCLTSVIKVKEKKTEEMDFKTSQEIIDHI